MAVNSQPLRESHAVLTGASWVPLYPLSVVHMWCCLIYTGVLHNFTHCKISLHCIKIYRCLNLGKQGGPGELWQREYISAWIPCPLRAPPPRPPPRPVRVPRCRDAEVSGWGPCHIWEIPCFRHHIPFSLNVASPSPFRENVYQWSKLPLTRMLSQPGPSWFWSPVWYQQRRQRHS